MRNYLYLWHQPGNKCIIASGIEFGDLCPELADTGGIILLRHQFDDFLFDATTRLEFVISGEMERLAADDIHGYGDFCWSDFNPEVEIARVSDQAIAELMFFAHSGRPLVGVKIPGLGNRFLYRSHDDGWYARIYYSDRNAMDQLLSRLLPRVLNEENFPLALDLVQRGTGAVWCVNGTFTECEATEDIDALQRKHRTTCDPTAS